MNYLAKLLDGAPVAWLPLGEVSLIRTGQAVSKQRILNNLGKYPVINSGREPLGFIDEWNADNDPIGVTTRGAGVGSITWQMGKYFRGNLNYSVTIKSSSQLIVRYLYHLLIFMQPDIQALCTFDGIPALNAGNLKELLIPIPCPDHPVKSLAIQGEIVWVLDKFSELNNECNLRKKQYNFYRDKLLTFPQDKVTWKTLGEVTTSISAGGDLPAKYLKGQTEPTEEFPYPIYSNGIDGKSLYGYTDGYRMDTEAVTISARGTIGWHTIRKPKFTPIVRLIVLIPNTKIVAAKFLDYILDVTEIGHSGGSIPQLTVPNVKKIKIPVPPLAEQARIVAMLDKFETMTNSISEGLPREIELRQKQYEYYRNQLLNFFKK